MRTTPAFSLLAALALVACGGSGESSSPPPPDRLDAARYFASFNQLGEFGELINDTSAAYVYASRRMMGFGTWTFATTGATSSMELLGRTIDDLGNETPGAQALNQVRALSVQKGSTAWSGGGLLLTRVDATAPDIAGIPRNWRHRNIFRFSGTEFIDYNVQIDVDTAGVLTGFDTNGCRFNGTITPRSGDPFYDLRLQAALCGDMNRFISEATYSGHAYILSEPGAGQTSLHLIGADRGLRVGLELIVIAP